MSHLLSSGKANKRLLLLSLLVTTATTISPVAAHKVQIAEDVGGTLHIEPNDNPQAGKAALIWIVMTRKGGQTIPLEQCNCQLAVYPKPHAEGSPPLLQPPLKPVSAEGYQGIPGAEIVFPKPGAYQLELSGTPKAGASFKPFQLNYEVTVAAGAAAPEAQGTNQQTSQSDTQEQTNGIVVATVLGLGSLWIVLQRVQGKRN